MSHTLNFCNFLKAQSYLQLILSLHFKYCKRSNNQLLNWSTFEAVIINLVSYFDNVEFYAFSGWYRKLFDTENAVAPKKSIFVRKRRY